MGQPENAQKVPLTLIRHQGPMMATIGRIAWDAVIPGGHPETNPRKFVDEQVILAAPPEKLVDHYASWSGSPGGYPLTLPSHMIAQWSIPLATKVLRQTRYNLATIINQGVTLRINGVLPRGVPLHLGASITNVEESEGKARVSVSLTTGTANEPTLIEAVLHSTFPLQRDTRPRKPHPADDDDWRAIGQWQASKSDGFKFASLTGDFNPIHWVGLAGRLSPFKTTVLQGFGMLARTFEVLNGVTPVDFLDVRFLKPVTLPSDPVTVQIELANTGQPRMRVVGTDARLHLAGTYGPAPVG